MNDEEIAMIGAGYGLAALCLQMMLLNSLADKGGVPKHVIEKIIAHAKSGIPLLADPEDAPETMAFAEAAIDRLAKEWVKIRIGN
jgi:hypothetical protein